MSRRESACCFGPRERTWSIVPNRPPLPQGRATGRRKTAETSRRQAADQALSIPACSAIFVVPGERPEFTFGRSPSTTRNGAWRSLASALDWGSRGRRFKSCRPDSRKARCNNRLRRACFRWKWQIQVPVTAEEGRFAVRNEAAVPEASDTAAFEGDRYAYKSIRQLGDDEPPSVRPGPGRPARRCSVRARARPSL